LNSSRGFVPPSTQRAKQPLRRRTEDCVDDLTHTHRHESGGDNGQRICFFPVRSSSRPRNPRRELVRSVPVQLGEARNTPCLRRALALCRNRRKPLCASPRRRIACSAQPGGMGRGASVRLALSTSMRVSVSVSDNSRLLYFCCASTILKYLLRRETCRCTRNASRPTAQK
jgi:hypothetical protein